MPFQPPEPWEIYVCCLSNQSVFCYRQRSATWMGFKHFVPSLFLIWPLWWLKRTSMWYLLLGSQTCKHSLPTFADTFLCAYIHSFAFMQIHTTHSTHAAFGGRSELSDNLNPNATWNESFQWHLEERVQKLKWCRVSTILQLKKERERERKFKEILGCWRRSVQVHLSSNDLSIFQIM